MLLCSLRHALRRGKLPYATPTCSILFSFKLHGEAAEIKKKQNKCCKDHIFYLILFRDRCADGIRLETNVAGN